ncbi:thioredoxin-like protein AAED1, chloroplastic isoform X1 [Gossypium australe]|uniref:Thioredoxin-like protein AAED1, chloroplastic isoform X1 n=1 Tax=Gossypium australe TaxID=47621 RepID=A0A5B6UN06_9ROSI|nr:thioredoxin-like protein AAED1, chloroplastic isoform X1 [Gossypium australe]
MAISLSTSLLPNTFQCNGNHIHRSTRLFPNQPLNFGLKHRRKENKLSTPRNPPVLSAWLVLLTGLESSAVSEDTVDLLDTVKVFDLNGNEIPISDLWKDRKAVVAFARHFGCVFCRKRADYLASKKAKTFAEQTKFKGEVYADPSHSSYNALRFVSGVTTTFTPKAGLKIIQLYMEGYRQDWKLSFEEDTVKRGGWYVDHIKRLFSVITCTHCSLCRQQGGILVAGPGKTNILYIHKDKEAGDDPDIEDILKACCS